MNKRIFFFGFVNLCLSAQKVFAAVVIQTFKCIQDIKIKKKWIWKSYFFSGQSKGDFKFTPFKSQGIASDN